MRYLALACDYDGTLAREGRVSAPALDAIARARTSGRRTLLVTGRRIDDLRAIFPQLDAFDCVVGENGTVLYWPSRDELQALAPPPPAAFVERLRVRGVTPLEVGEVIVATVHPREIEVVTAIHDLALELQIVFNEDAVMVLPPGANKGTGLRAALQALGLSTHEVVTIGNAANDHSLLEAGECGVAVADAHPSLRAKASFVTRGENDLGVIELVEELVATDLAGRSAIGPGRDLVLGMRADESPVTCSAYGHNILVVGPSGSGKSSFASGFIERLVQREFQVCIVDPEGDYGTLDDIVTLGTRLRAPEIEEVVRVLSDSSASLVVNLLGVPLADRPWYFAQLLPQLQALRARTGRPHWIVLDEVHHLLPETWGLGGATLPQRLGETVLITMRATDVARSIVALADIGIAVGPSPERSLADFAAAIGVPAPTPTAASGRGGRGEVVCWNRGRAERPVWMRVLRARSERLRHLRKYAEGDLGPKAFVFRGPEGKLQLRATNLVLFCEMARGVDVDTWTFHLRAGDYSEWLRRRIKDPDLADEVAEIERSGLAPAESRARVCEAIDRRYVGR